MPPDPVLSANLFGQCKHFFVRNSPHLRSQPSPFYHVSHNSDTKNACSHKSPHQHSGYLRPVCAVDSRRPARDLLHIHYGTNPVRRTLGFKRQTVRQIPVCRLQKDQRNHIVEYGKLQKYIYCFTWHAPFFPSPQHHGGSQHKASRKRHRYNILHNPLFSSDNYSCVISSISASSFFFSSAVMLFLPLSAIQNELRLPSYNFSRSSSP